VNPSTTRKNFITRLTAAAALFGLTGESSAFASDSSPAAATSSTNTERQPVVVKPEQRAVARRADSV
jgi:hypothetical protein